MLDIKKLVSPVRRGLTRALLPMPLSALDFARDGIVLLDRAGQIADMNAEARRLINFVDADLSGRDFWDTVLPDVAEPQQIAAERAMQRMEEHSFIAHRQFEGIWLEYTFRPYAAGYVVNLKDVTAFQSLQLQLAEIEFSNRLLFKSNPNAMWVFDLACLHVIDANQGLMVRYIVAVIHSSSCSARMALNTRRQLAELGN